MRTAAILRDESGQSLVFTALCLTCVVGILAFAVDAGVLLRARRFAQIAADSAAIAGAAELNYGDNTWVKAKARAAAAQNGITHGSNGGTVTVNNPPLSGPHSGDSGYVEVIASQSQPTFFIQVFNQNGATVSARAVAGGRASDGCIYALDPTLTKSFWVTGSGAMSMPNCAIYIDSRDSSAMNTTGSGTISAASIGIVGGANNLQTVTPTPMTGMAPVPDPLAFLAPPTIPGNCSTQINYSSGTHTVGPGCYAKFNISGSGTNITTNPGVYIIKGTGVGIINITGSATITGTGVTFFVTGGGTSSINGSGTMNISAPTTGTYNGILFYEDRNYSADVTVTGSNGTTLNGIIYCPKATLTFTGSTGSNLYANVITNAFKASGTFTMNNYALINPATPLRRSSIAE